MMKVKNIFREGVFTQNPVLIQLVGLCSVLGVTTTAMNGLAMGIAVTAVLVLANIVVSSIRKIIPSKIRIPIYIVVIATFVTLVEMILKAYAQPIYKALGLFIPLIVVNCAILARAESFASKNNVFLSAIDGLSCGLGYSISVIVLGIIRELFGKGSIFGFQIFGEWFTPIMIFGAPAGAFIVLGFLIAAWKKMLAKTNA